MGPHTLIFQFLLYVATLNSPGSQKINDEWVALQNLITFLEGSNI